MITTIAVLVTVLLGAWIVFYNEHDKRKLDPRIVGMLGVMASLVTLLISYLEVGGAVVPIVLSASTLVFYLLARRTKTVLIHVIVFVVGVGGSLLFTLFNDVQMNTVTLPSGGTMVIIIVCLVIGAGLCLLVQRFLKRRRPTRNLA